MLRYNFERVLKARGIDRPYAYLVQQGVHGHLASGIRKNKVRLLRMDSLEKICLILHCTPNDIMEWVPDERQASDGDQPMNDLKRNDVVIHLTQTLNALPLDKVEEVVKFAEEQMNKQD
jgi:DNA-binding Xre family transcriptional regulator